MTFSRISTNALFMSYICRSSIIRAKVSNSAKFRRIFPVFSNSPIVKSYSNINTYKLPFITISSGFLIKKLHVPNIESNIHTPLLEYYFVSLSKNSNVALLISSIFSNAGFEFIPLSNRFVKKGDAKDNSDKPICPLPST